MICFASIPLPVSNGSFAPTSHVHMLVTMYVYMYICIYVYMYIRIYVYMYICIYVYMYIVCVKSIILILPLWSLYHYNIIVISSNIFIVRFSCYIFWRYAMDISSSMERRNAMAWEMPGISPICRWRRGWSMWMCQCPPRRRSSNGIMRSSDVFSWWKGCRLIDWSLGFQGSTVPFFLTRLRWWQHMGVIHTPKRRLLDG